MGKLQKKDGSSVRPLPARCLIGRSRICQLRLSSPETSGEHALLRWRDGGWELQDLHSHNGTYVNGRLLDSGSRVELVEGSQLGFGRPDEYILVDAAPPQPHAVNLDSAEATSVAVGGALALPDTDEPSVIVVHLDQRWWIERGEDLLPIGDGDLVEVDAERWRLHLPEALPTTQDSEDVVPSLVSLTFRFVVQGDGESVALWALHGRWAVDLNVRAHHRPLLQLARAWLRDRALHGDARGWVEHAKLIELLGYDRNRLNVEIHRLRRQLAAAGIRDAGRVVERCRKRRALRLCASKVEIMTAEESRRRAAGTAPTSSRS